MHKASAQEEAQYSEPSEEFVIMPNWMQPRLYLDDDNILRRELSLHLHGGFSSLEYGTTMGVSSGWLNNIANTYDYLEYLSIGGGITYTYFFKPQVGLIFGLEGANYKGFMETANIQEQFEEFIPALDLHTGEFFKDGIESVVTNKFGRYMESQSVWYVQMPLLVQLNPNLRKRRVRFFAAVGAKAGMTIYGANEMNTSGSTTIKIPQYLQTLENVGHGTGQFVYSKSEKMSMDFNISASLELGIRWRLAPEYALYTGIYADYGFLDILSRSEEQQKNYIRPLGKTQQNSILSSRHTDAVGSLAAGVKLRLAFGKLVLSEAGEERTREMTKSYLRVMVRASPANTPMPVTLKAAMDNVSANKIDSFVYDLDDATFRIPLPKGSDYSIAFNVEYPDNAAPDSMLSQDAAQTDVPQFSLEPSRWFKKYTDESAMSTVKILLLNQKTGKPLPAKIRVVNIDNDDIDSANTAATGGMFFMKTNPGSFHRIIFNVNVPTPPIPFKKMKTGAKITMKGMFFATNSAVLTQEIKDNLQELIEFLKNYPQLRVEISGHTDNKGNKNKNQEISEKRAKAIVEYLAEQGIAPERLVAKGYGDKRPIASNKNNKGRSKNRRVEVKIIK
jgi:outer membrane protein OmpA-like peptidoglycan-associated protein